MKRFFSIIGLVLALSIVNILSKGIWNHFALMRKVKQAKKEINFDKTWLDLSVEYSEKFNKNIDTIAEIILNNVEQTCLNNQVPFTNSEKEQLKKDIVLIILKFDYYGYFFDSKKLFWQKMEMTEDDFARTIIRIDNAEDMMNLRKRVKAAAAAVGEQVFESKGQDVIKSINTVMNNFWQKKKLELIKMKSMQLPKS